MADDERDVFQQQHSGQYDADESHVELGVAGQLSPSMCIHGRRSRGGGQGGQVPPRIWSGGS